MLIDLQKIKLFYNKNRKQGNEITGKKKHS